MAAPDIRDILKEARQIAEAEFGRDTVRDVPLLVTNIALAMVQLSPASGQATATFGDMSN